MTNIPYPQELEDAPSLARDREERAQQPAEAQRPASSASRPDTTARTEPPQARPRTFAGMGKPYRGWQQAMRRAIRLLEPSRQANSHRNLDGRDKTRMQGPHPRDDAEIWFEHWTRFLCRPDGLWRDALLALVSRIPDNPERDVDGWPLPYSAEAVDHKGPYLKVKNQTGKPEAAITLTARPHTRI